MINKFFDFCEERELIKIKKESNKPFPWSEDLILQKHKFTNINRNDDRGTRLLFNLVETKCKTFEETLKAICIYRFSGSLNDHINMMSNTPSNLWFEKLKETKLLFNQTAYQCGFPKGKGSGIHFLREILEQVVNDFYINLTQFNNISILNGAKVLCDIFVKYKYKRMNFQATEICKDLAYFKPEYINIDSECTLGPGAKKGLKIIFNTGKKSNMKFLLNNELNKKNYNYSILEHGLCEFSKYCEFQSGKRKKHTKLYTPNKVSVEELCKEITYFRIDITESK